MIIFAMQHMSLTFRFIFFTIGLVCFAVGTFAGANWRKLELTAAGLAFITFPIWWDLLADLVNEN